MSNERSCFEAWLPEPDSKLFFGTDRSRPLIHVESTAFPRDGVTIKELAQWAAANFRKLCGKQRVTAYAWKDGMYRGTRVSGW